ncbi:hypothetical protein [Curtobacterium sp. L1-20]|uniref:hypothetical protein n=1 Tax=Curtobacterium sp. L1-20 TaxID=3138181 RepID=UPI003B52DEA5
MTDLRVDAAGAPRLRTVGQEARPALLTLVTPGVAPICEGDSCLVDSAVVVPGAEGDWTEVPD